MNHLRLTIKENHFFFKNYYNCQYFSVSSLLVKTIYFLNKSIYYQLVSSEFIVKRYQKNVNQLMIEDLFCI